MIDLAIQAVTLTVSLLVLALAGHFTIRWVEDFIEFSGFSEASVGFAVLSVMTSTPEMTVAVFSVLQGAPGVSVGDIFGSNVANIGLVVGIMALIAPLEACCTDLLTEMVDVLFLSSLIPILLVVFGVLSPFVGVLLFGVFAYTIYLMVRGKSPASVDEETVADKGVTIERPKEKNRKAILAKMVGGIAIVVVAARFAVSSASDIATLLGVPPILIGAKIVAVGTSLPELVINISAVRRGRPRLALGNAVGSNLTNLTLILGVVLLTSPFTVDLTIFTETLPFLLISTLFLWRSLTKGGVSKLTGILLLMTYVVFLAVL